MDILLKHSTGVLEEKREVLLPVMGALMQTSLVFGWFVLSLIQQDLILAPPCAGLVILLPSFWPFQCFPHLPSPLHPSFYTWGLSSVFICILLPLTLNSPLNSSVFGQFSRPWFKPILFQTLTELLKHNLRNDELLNYMWYIKPTFWSSIILPKILRKL